MQSKNINKDEATQALNELKRTYDKIHGFKNFEWRIEFSKLLNSGNAEQINLAKQQALEKGEKFTKIKDTQGDFIGFDLVIGNPPYIGEKGHKEMFELVKKGQLGKFYQGKMDYFYFFFHLGLNILRENGILSFITTNYYPTAMGGENLRKDLRDRSQIISLINFSTLKIFDSAQGQHNMITTLQKTPHPQSAKIYTFNDKFSSLNKISLDLQGCLDSREITSFCESSELYEGDECYIRLNQNAEFDSIFDKMTKGAELLGKICNINQGIVSGADKVTDKHLNEYKWAKNGIKKNDGIFALTQVEIDNLHLEKEHLKPFFKNSNIQKYTTDTQTTHKILYLTGNEKDIPNILAHLSRFKDKLQETHEKHNGSGEWWNLWRPRKQEIFENQKIVAPQRSKTNTFGYNECEWYASADVYFITPLDTWYNLKYILALLNSKLYYFWLYNKGKRKGEDLELYERPLSKIPIKPASQPEQEKFVDLVNQILEFKKQGKDTSEFEKDIDNLVYKLYNLDKNEIQIIQG